MCGIFGVIQRDTKLVRTSSVPDGVYLNKSSNGADNILKVMCSLSTLRGTDSTGIAQIDFDSTEVVVSKLPVDGVSFIGTKDWDQGTSKTHLKNMGWIGHTRFGTIGGNSWRSSHPFEFETIVGVHNGTLNNYHTLYDKAISDSEALYYKFNSIEDGDYISVLENIRGSFALVWYDKISNNIMFTRNKERPLYYLKNDNGIIFASELEFIHFATNRCLSKKDNDAIWNESSYGIFKEDTLYEYDPLNGVMEEEKYKSFVKPPFNNSSNYAEYYYYTNKSVVPYKSTAEKQIPYSIGNTIEIFPISASVYSGINENNRGTIIGYAAKNGLRYYVEIFGVIDAKKLVEKYSESWATGLSIMTATVTKGHSCTPLDKVKDLVCPYTGEKLYFSVDEDSLDLDTKALTIICNPDTLKVETLEDKL